MARGAVALCGALLACSVLAAPASAGPGSGSASILPPDSVLAGSAGTWKITYFASEDFDTTTGGTVDIVVPPGWTAPQATDSTVAGYVGWTDPQVDSLAIAGQTIRVYLGGGPHLATDTELLAGNAVSVRYGAGGGPASARAQTTAPATAVFQVLSDPQLTGAPQPIASSPSLTVLHGAYAGLTMTAGVSSAIAGSGFAVTASARDADGNTVTDGAGSSAAVRFEAFADSVGAASADPRLVSAGAVLSGGTYSGSLTARSAGTFYFAVSDTASGFVSERHRIAILPAGPDHMTLSPDTLRLTAGAPDTVSVRVFDAYENRTPVLAPETLTLWTDRPNGAFRNLSGSTIFEVTVPAGEDSARFTFTDTQTTVAAGHVRAIDANGQAPFLGTAGASVTTGPSVPATLALRAAPDTLVANGVDSVLVSGTASDAYGNTVSAGERFTLTGSASPLVTPVTDDDPGTSGHQLLADSAGAVRGFVRVGTAAGTAGATVTAERPGPGGPAAATVAIRLLSGAPSGVIALSAPPDSLAADSVATLAVGAGGLQDAGGNPVADGEKYTVATTLGSIQTPDADPATPGIQVAASSGAIVFTLFGGDVLGTATVSAKAVRDTTSAGTLDVRLVPGGVSRSRSTLLAASPAPVGAAGSVVSVTLRDSQDHALAGVGEAEILVSVTGLTATVSALAPATDASGRLDFRATTPTAGAGTAHAVARGVPLAAQPTILFQPGPLDHYTVTGPAGPLTAGAAVTLAIQAFDSFGNPLPGESGEELRPTVTSGAATVPDSVALASGAASIPVTPTLAAPLTIDVSDGMRRVTYGPVAVNPSGASTLTLAPDSLALDPTQVKTVTVTVRDSQGNPIGGHAVTFYLGGPTAAGTLESIGGTSGGPGSQSGATKPSGKLAIRYRAPMVAPAVDSIFVSDGSAAPAGIRAATHPGATASLRVTPASLAWTAGVPESVRVQAVDAFGNPVTTDAATVTMQAVGSMVWSPASGPLAAGVFLASGRDTVAESAAIGADRSGGGSGSGGSATVSPAAPAGPIAIAATRDSLTADGRSASTVTLGPVRDAFGNLAPAGTLVGVSAQTGTLLAADASVVFPGLDLATGANGLASVVLIAGGAAGPDTLRAATRAGTAAGSHAFTYVPPPSLSYVAGSLTPGAVTPGSAVPFSLQARNTGTGAIQIGAGSSFSFGSGATAFAATLASAAAVGAGATATLTFASAVVPAALPPGAYAPSFRVLGTDGTGAAFDFYLSLAGSQVSVLGVGVAAVSASPDPVPLGSSALSVVFDVSNVSGTPGNLTGASVGYSTGAFVTGAPTPPLGTTIPAGATTRFTFPVQVPASGIPSGTTVNATLQATVTYGGNAVTGANAVPLGFRVVSAARVAAVP